MNSLVKTGLGLALMAAAATDIALAGTGRATILAESRALDAARIPDFGNNTNVLLRPGLIADRTSRTVRLSAESTELDRNDPVEFLLITIDSGKDYEALAVSFASAADIHQALEFIGLKPGLCVNQATLRFWPKGDRVRVTFRYRNPRVPDTPRPEPNRHSPEPKAFIEVQAEQLVLDSRTGKTLPETGFVFTGSERVPAPGNGTGLVYSADAFSPGSIISIYNDPSTVLDVPRRTAQQEVYARQVPNPDLGLPPGILVEVLLEPFYRDNLPHRSDYILAVAPGKDAEPVYSLTDAAGQTVNSNRTLNGLLATLGRLTGPDQDVFVVLHPDDALPLKAMPTLAQVLGSLDTERGIRLEPPPAGHPYFKAFVPNEALRKRENRPAAAAELHIASSGSGTTGTLVLVEAKWNDDAAQATYKETRIPIPAPAALDPALAGQEYPPTIMLVFAPSSLTYGEFRTFVAPLLQRRMVLYVFRQDS